jgi:hypothetical protein
MTEKNKPAHTIRGSVGSGLKLTIWPHESDKGPWFTATPTKSYKDDAGWHETTSFKQQDFLELSEMFREAHAWVKEQTRAQAAQQSQDTPQGGYAEQETRKRAGRAR